MDNMSSSFTKVKSKDKFVMKCGQSAATWSYGFMSRLKRTKKKIKEKKANAAIHTDKWKCWQVKQGKVRNTTPTVLANIAIANIIHKHFPLSLLITISIIYHYSKCTKIHPTYEKQTKQLPVIEAAWQKSIV